MTTTPVQLIYYGSIPISVMAAETILIISIALLFWIYLLYPLLMIMSAAIKRKKDKTVIQKPPEIVSPRTTVSVIMSVFNEEKIIREKIISLLSSDYPDNLTEIIIGSDGSADGTNNIISEMALTDKRLNYIFREQRRGKPAMLNDLVPASHGEILIITDANVIFTPSTVSTLVKGINHTGNGLCDASVSPKQPDSTGISRQENMYGQFETILKRAEGDLWGAMPGPYGGCYAVRRELFPLLPENILVDDLYVGLTVLGAGFKSRNIREAAVHEDTQPDMSAQFRRRVRIAAGSFQNLFHFGLFPSKRFSVFFTFFSHKILRWLTPVLIILFFMTTIILSGGSVFYFCLLTVQLIFILLSALDLLLDKRGKKIRFQRYITQFLLMNAALTAGFVKAVKGIKTGIWEPTKRV